MSYKTYEIPNDIIETGISSVVSRLRLLEQLTLMSSSSRYFKVSDDDLMGFYDFFHCIADELEEIKNKAIKAIEGDTA